MVRYHFRPHHFLCMLTYIGKGYTSKFTKNFDEICARLSTEECEIAIINAPDDICTPRLCDLDDKNCHCYSPETKAYDEKAIDDFQKIPSLRHINTGNIIRLTNELKTALRDDYRRGNIRTACQECEWKDLCDEVVKNNFQETKLR